MTGVDSKVSGTRISVSDTRSGSNAVQRLSKASALHLSRSKCSRVSSKSDGSKLGESMVSPQVMPQTVEEHNRLRRSVEAAQEPTTQSATSWWAVVMAVALVAAVFGDQFQGNYAEVALMDVYGANLADVMVQAVAASTAFLLIPFWQNSPRGEGSFWSVFGLLLLLSWVQAAVYNYGTPFMERTIGVNAAQAVTLTVRAVACALVDVLGLGVRRRKLGTLRCVALVCSVVAGALIVFGAGVDLPSGVRTVDSALGFAAAAGRGVAMAAFHAGEAKAARYFGNVQKMNFCWQLLLLVNSFVLFLATEGFPVEKQEGPGDWPIAFGGIFYAILDACRAVAEMGFGAVWADTVESSAQIFALPTYGAWAPFGNPKKFYNLLQFLGVAIALLAIALQLTEHALENRKPKEGKVRSTVSTLNSRISIR